MCGICGLIDFQNGSPEADTLRAMVASIRHRGPDDSGIHRSGPAGLGQARLSILDLSPAGHQPMLSPGGECALVYNGEIYNYREIGRELEGRGHAFRGHSDTEVLLHAWLEWGGDALEKLEGMFALALWDERDRSLHLARDRFGIKPLYYYPLERALVFGSEVKALLASDRVGRGLSPQGLSEYLYFGTALGANSLFEGVRKLLPGHRLRFSESGVSEEEYASIYPARACAADEHEAVETLREKLSEAVRSHLVSDVPVGVFLSGGIDSSTLTALASQHYSGRLSSYSVGFDFEGGVNELPKARRVAEHFGTEHHELQLKGGDLPGLIERLVRAHDEPFGDVADVPLYLLCEALKDSVKVILQGDGGDEIFAGYRRYQVLARERRWRLGARAALPFWNLLPASAAKHRYGRFLRAAAESDPALKMAWLLTVETPARPPETVLTAEAQQQLKACDPMHRYRQFARRFQDLDPVQRMLYTDCGIILPDIFLEKVDKATMAHGIEVRVPMLDTRLAQYAMSLPASLKVRQGEKKWALRRAMRGIVPDDILDAPKTGFGVPYSHWLRGAMSGFLREVLLDPGLRDWQLLDQAVLERRIEEHVSGARDNGFLLYKLLLLALWRRYYLKRGAT